MSNNDQPKNFFGQGSNFNSDKIRVEILAEQEPIYHQKIPLRLVEDKG
ncbi:MAG: hypothetical protein V7K40_10590 [Nostoc sp.]